MPIIRTYACAECMHMMDVVLSMEQVDDPAPECPACAQRAMRQEFRPIAIGGSNSARAHRIAEDIAENDYHVGDMQVGRKEGDTTKVRYKDQNGPVNNSTWTAARDVLETAIAAGRQNRLQHGSGLDVLKAGLDSGAQPDLIEASKRRAIKIW